MVYGFLQVQDFFVNLLLSELYQIQSSENHWFLLLNRLLFFLFVSFFFFYFFTESTHFLTKLKENLRDDLE